MVLMVLKLFACTAFATWIVAISAIVWRFCRAFWSDHGWNKRKRSILNLHAISRSFSFLLIQPLFQFLFLHNFVFYTIHIILPIFQFGFYWAQNAMPLHTLHYILNIQWIHRMVTEYIYLSLKCKFINIDARVDIQLPIFTTGSHLKDISNSIVRYVLWIAV